MAVAAALPLSAQGELNRRLDEYLSQSTSAGQLLRIKGHLSKLHIDDSLRTVTVEATTHYGERIFTPASVEKTYHDIHVLLPDTLQDYKLSVTTGGWPIEQLIPTHLQTHGGAPRNWGDTDYQGRPWVSNASRPYAVSKGLYNRHLCVWASHGIYYNISQNTWKWQRPPLFGSGEDHFTQTIVYPYLIPMLERAGAVVFTPRERDWQQHEVIVDNDYTAAAMGQYSEMGTEGAWQQSLLAGFRYHEGNYTDHENPFEAGTVRQAATTLTDRHHCQANYIPQLPEAGRYAVYVSYQTVEGSIDDAHYTVWHKGVATEFRVNQQMGGGTWVYLGTFDFDEGLNAQNCVVLSNKSRQQGIVTTDAVRFGGGMGNIERGGRLSGMPRCLEGARYYAQWAGMPYEVYSSKEGKDDYGDDINARSYMANLLGGGSCYMPDTTGRHVPIELSLAVHSDAGYTSDGRKNTGTLAICMTTFRDSLLNAGTSRLASRDFADELLTSIPQDMLRKFGKWQMRELYDRNYSECRVPEVPSAIIETMSHQNFADMRMGQDPVFRFWLARSIYKTMLRYTARMHNTDYVVSPLAPTALSVELTEKGEALLRWTPTDDPSEPTSAATDYIIYTAVEDGGFDNGTMLHSQKTSALIRLEPDRLYSFRVAAVNEGGESFPSEVVSALYNPTAQKTVLVVNGFRRLASPQVREGLSEQGFDLAADIGVSEGLTAGWRGYQTNFDRWSMGKEGPTGLGYTNDSLSGQFIGGNDFNYIRTHARAIASARRYSIASCALTSVIGGRVSMQHYALTDLILGLQRQDGYALVQQQAFPSELRMQLRDFTQRGGALLVSGSYIGRDMRLDADQQFLADIMKCQYAGTNADSLQRDSINGLGIAFPFHRQLTHRHYAAQHPDNLMPVEPAYTAMLYGDQQSAAVAYSGNDYRVFTMGFPFECIQEERTRSVVMRGLLTFLLEN
ncbi:MAG: fibronectin type III domain-containing protein [Prevotella sp.]|nr:fibronectin type III domain-containing protein [Prevotella sp.]